MTADEKERWFALRKLMLHQIGECKHLLKMIAQSQEGARQQQSVAIDSMHSEIREVKIMLASIQHKLDEPPPE